MKHFIENMSSKNCPCATRTSRQKTAHAPHKHLVEKLPTRHINISSKNCPCATRTSRRKAAPAAETAQKSHKETTVKRFVGSDAPRYGRFRAVKKERRLRRGARRKRQKETRWFHGEVGGCAGGGAWARSTRRFCFDESVWSFVSAAPLRSEPRRPSGSWRRSPGLLGSSSVISGRRRGLSGYRMTWRIWRWGRRSCGGCCARRRRSWRARWRTRSISSSIARGKLSDAELATVTRRGARRKRQKERRLFSRRSGRLRRRCRKSTPRLPISGTWQMSGPS